MRQRVVKAGEVLYGPRWKAPLAALLGMGVRTMQGWSSGQQTPSWDTREILAKRLPAIPPPFHVAFPRPRMQILNAARERNRNRRSSKVERSTPKVEQFHLSFLINIR